MVSSSTALAGQQREHAAGLQPAAVDDPLQHALAVARTRAWACSPTTSSLRIAGNGPARSQVWKNGPQSMQRGDFGQVHVA
jgi:hypothetical protein